MTEDDTDNAENGEAEDEPTKSGDETSEPQSDEAENSATAEGSAESSDAPDFDDDDDDGWSNLPAPGDSEQDLEAVYDIPVRVSAVLGKSSMQVNNILRLGRGAVVELDRKVGEAIDIYVNDHLVARGELAVVDKRLGVTMTEIVKTQKG